MAGHPRRKTGISRSALVAHAIALAGLTTACVSLPPPVATSERWWEEKPLPTPTPSPTPQATPIRCEIPVLDREPAEPFDFLGLVEVQKAGAVHTRERAVEAARLQACRLGGQAIVLLYVSPEVPSRVERAPPARGILPDVAVRAAVIRYRR